MVWVYLIFLFVSFGASVAGAICGIGGGVIIKPVLDAFGVLDVAVISFLSGCTVLAMSCYSVVKAVRSKDLTVDKKTGTPLALGAAAGGIVGKLMFETAAGMFADRNTVGAVQAGCLAVITLGTLVYTLKKNSIRTHKLENRTVCLIIGLFLGIMSSFLGIGGGPINLVVLYFFFSMDTKVAAHNSLYIILFSQAASFLNTVVEGSLPAFSPLLLAGMVFCGIMGGVCGRAVNKKMDAPVVEKLFIGLMGVIIAISLYNVIHYM